MSLRVYSIGQGFQPNREAGLVRRIAEFLDYCARFFPGQVVPYPRIAEVVLSLRAAPADDTPDVRRIKKLTYKTRPVLAGHFNRDLVTASDSGARASIGPLDAVVSGLRPVIDRLEAHCAAAVHTGHFVAGPSVSLDRYPEVSEWKAQFDRVLNRARVELGLLSVGLERAALHDIGTEKIEQQAA